MTRVYYLTESVGLACGFLVAALHLAGLATLTHTPRPTGFLRRILGRPKHEKPYLLIPLGYPATDAVVPTITRKPLDEVGSNSDFDFLVFPMLAVGSWNDR